MTIAGHTIDAPGFTPDSFDRAVKRAHDEGLTVLRTSRTRHVRITSSDRKRTYLVSRDTCTCRAGQQGMPCKHRALAIFLNDIMGERIAQPSPRRHSA